LRFLSYGQDCKILIVMFVTANEFMSILAHYAAVQAGFSDRRTRVKKTYPGLKTLSIVTELAQPFPARSILNKNENRRI